MFTSYGILLVIRIGEQFGPLVVGVFAFEHINIGFGFGHVAFACIEQVKMIIYICHVGVVGEIAKQTCEGFLAQRQVVELVFEYHSSVEQSVLKQLVACRKLFWGEGYLCQIVFAFQRIVACRIEFFGFII